MSSKAHQPFLPPDIILYIIDCVIPSWADTEVAYPRSHAITSTLLTLTRTSRLIYPTARRLLYTHCLYIDSPRRLRSLLCSLAAYTTESIASKSPTIQHETSLYLSPFPNETINDLPTAQAVHDLLSLLAPTLRRLVVDIPLRSLYPEDDTLNIRPILRSAFKKLTSLELFCSARDELFLDCAGWPANRDEVNVWSLWPKLKVLALYNCDVDPAWSVTSPFWRDLAALKNLEILVLTRCDGVQDVDFKAEWNARCGKGSAGLDVVFVDVDGGHGILETVEEPRDGDKVAVMVGRVPTSYYGDEDIIELCQDWIKRAMLRGERGLRAELRNLGARLSIER
jgi:hypothetical protein